MSQKKIGIALFVLVLVAVLASLVRWLPRGEVTESTTSIQKAIESNSKSSVPKALEDMLDKISIVREFQPEIPGVSGWVIQIRGQGEDTQSVVYTINDGNYLLVGNIIRDGTNITMQHMNMHTAVATEIEPEKEQAGQQTSLPPSNEYAINFDVIRDIIDTQPIVSIGSGDVRVAVVVDANCRFCHSYFASLMQDFGNDNVVFDFIPVGLIGMDSVHKAALFDGKSDAEKIALLESMMRGERMSEIPGAGSIDASMARTRAWTSAGLNVVPLTIFNLGSENQVSIPGAISKEQMKTML